MLSFIRSLFFGVKSNNSGEKSVVSTRNKTKYVKTPPANSTPTKQVVLLEEDEEDIDLSKGVIRSEVNFLAYPFFALSRKDAAHRSKTEYHTTIERGDEKLDVSWKVSANPEYGYPSPFDRKVHRAIEQIISNLKRPIKNPIPLGSFRNLAKLMDVGLSKKGTLSGRTYKEIEDSLTRIVATTAHSKRTFYDKGRKRWLEAVFHLYDQVVFAGEILPNGEVADTNYLFLGNWYLDNINARYVKPLDFTYYRSLKNNIASRLYELLGVKFYGMGHHPYIRYRYSTLCQLLPVTQYQRPSKAKEILNPAHDELTSSKFLAKIEWQEIPNEKHDWYVCYWAGTRAKEEIKQFSKQGVLPPPDDLQLRQSTATTTPQQADEDVNEDVVLALQNFGISKKQAVKLAKGHEHEYILEKLELVQWFRDTKSPLVAKNPAGFARRAIEDDYPAPPQYKSKKQLALEAEQREQEEQLRLNCALCEGTGYYKVAEDRMAACLHGAK
jgi:replication initiator protein A